jgi:hypothetical protein
MGIDLMGSKEPLMVLELTPDIILEVPVTRLCEVMGIVEDCVRKLQSYCRDWNARLAVKRAQVKRRRLY